MTVGTQKAFIALTFAFLLIGYTNCSKGFQAAGTSNSSSSELGAPEEPVVYPTPTATANPTNPTATPAATATPGATATPIAAGKKAVFFGIGHMGRSIFTCDDGQTWIHDRSDNDATRCWVTGDANYVECDHTPYSATGSAGTFGDGYFYAAFGWGYNGVVRRTRDGVNWEQISSGSWGGGTAYAQGTLFLLRDQWRYSSNQGLTWANATKTGFNEYTLDHPMPFTVGTTLFAAGRAANGGPELAMSTDGGKAWRLSTGFSGTQRSIVGSSSVMIAIGNTAGVVGRSTDGGVTWSNRTISGLSDGWKANAIYTGSQFVLWAGTRKFTSADGLNWTASTSNVPWSNSVVSYNPQTGVYVAILNEWDNYYTKQRAYRSVDGNTWTTLSSAAFKGGHPINQIVLGEMDESACR